MTCRGETKIVLSGATATSHFAQSKPSLSGTERLKILSDSCSLRSALVVLFNVPYHPVVVAGVIQLNRASAA